MVSPTWSECFDRRPRRQRASRKPVRLHLEVLEERSLLATFTVIDLGDAGQGSGLEGDLRYAVNAANANGDLSNHIQFQPGLTGTITLHQGPLLITKNLEIDGPGQDLLAVSGNHQFGVFEILNAPNAQDVRFTDLTIADGLGSTGGTVRRGGGLFNDRAAVTLTRVTVAGNLADGNGQGGGIYNGSGTVTLESSTVTANQVGFGGLGGGIYNASGTVTLEDSSVTANQTGINGFGTAVYNVAGSVIIRTSSIAANVGAAGFPSPAIYDIATTSSVTVSDSSILDNDGSGILEGTAIIDHSLIADNGGLGVDAVAATIDHSTISGNALGGIFTFDYLMLTDSTVAENRLGSAVVANGYAMVSGCTIVGNSAAAFGGGFETYQGFAEILNSTISDNTAPAGGGVEVGSAKGTIELISCTVVGNHATGTSGGYQGGGGIGLFGTGRSKGTIVLRNSIVAGNTTATTGPDVDGVVISLNYNFIGAADDSSGWLNQDHLGTSENPLDPQLGPLQDNGGPTLTHAPLAGSPVLFAGDPFVSGPDQRGSFRQTSTPGAVAADAAVAFRVTGPSVVASGQPFQLTVTAVDQWGNTASSYAGTVHFSSTDLSAQLPDDYPFGAADGGAHTFDATLQTPGPQTILIQDTSNASLAAALNVLVTDGSAPFSEWWNHHGLSRIPG